MPIKNKHGLYTTIISAMPRDVENEVDRYCSQYGFLKCMFVLNVFGAYDSSAIISMWFSVMWEKYKQKGIDIAVIDRNIVSKAHYDKVVKIMPRMILHEVFVYAAMNSVKKSKIVEAVFASYDFRMIIDAWFHSVWMKSKHVGNEKNDRPFIQAKGIGARK